jgi:hypothetical protein
VYSINCRCTGTSPMALFQFVKEPGARQAPIAPHRGNGHSEGFSGFLEAQAAEETHLHDLALTQNGRYSIKGLHRQIMLSRVYQLSSADSAVNAAKDSGNRLYWRGNRRRLSAEQIRDAVLAVSGALEDKVGGPSLALTATATRRTVYGKVSRYKLDPYLQLFDFPAATISADRDIRPTFRSSGCFS